MEELLLQFKSCSPAQGRRSSGGQDPGAKKTEEGLVLLTFEAEQGELRELLKCLLSRVEAGRRGSPFRVMSMGSGGS